MSGESKVVKLPPFVTGVMRMNSTAPKQILVQLPTVSDIKLPPFFLCPWKLYKWRLYNMLFNLPGMFLSGFFWQGMSYAYIDNYPGTNADTAGFYFMTGLGSGIGTGLGQILCNFQVFSVTGLMLPKLPSEQFFHGICYGLACFLGSSTIWQALVNCSLHYSWSFVETFFFVFWFSSMTFWLSLMVWRFCTAIIFPTSSHIHLSESSLASERDYLLVERVIMDLQIALSVGMADAFFLGTLADTWSDNFLDRPFGVPAEMGRFRGMCRAGASTVLGFTIMQLLQNYIVGHLCWLDRTEILRRDFYRKRSNLKMQQIRDGDDEQLAEKWERKLLKEKYQKKFEKYGIDDDKLPDSNVASQEVLSEAV
jgi:hypothetical protein